jgi:hypothetical protein
MLPGDVTDLGRHRRGAGTRRPLCATTDREQSFTATNGHRVTVHSGLSAGRQTMMAISATAPRGTDDHPDRADHPDRLPWPGWSHQSDLFTKSPSLTVAESWLPTAISTVKFAVPRTI